MGDFVGNGRRVAGLRLLQWELYEEWLIRESHKR